MSTIKQCKQCSRQFVVEDADLEFYKRISPTFNGKTFEIPPPKLCPECREIRRLTWRNERHLYKRKCDLCQKDIISVYSPDKPYTVYCQQCWWSDKWDPRSYGLEYKPGKFKEQFADLYLKVPKIGTSVVNSQNCEFNANMVDSKDCFMVFSSLKSENCLFGRKIVDCSETLDSCFASRCTDCYEIIYAEDCNRCFFVQYCSHCYDSIFLLDCIGCNDCFMCTNLRNKEFYFYNKPMAKEEYYKKINELWNGSYKKLEGLKNEYHEMMKKAVHRENENINCEDCLGENLLNCKNCQYCFSGNKNENCKYINDSWSVGLSDAMDCTICSGELVYDSVSVFRSYNCIFGSLNYQNNRNLIFCVDCFNGCRNLFACASMKKSSYCILNKKYNPDDYEKLASQIIEELKSLGDWGEFFPMSFSPFAYNESLAMNYFPKSKKSALKIGANWEDDEISKEHKEEIYEPHDNIHDYVESDQKREKLLDGTIKCKETGRVFKILPQELFFYIKHKIPIPRLHYFVRADNRSKLLNPRTFFQRKCDSCGKQITTTYDPDRPEKVYCESCYQKSIL